MPEEANSERVSKDKSYFLELKSVQVSFSGQTS